MFQLHAGPLNSLSWVTCSFFHHPNPHWFLLPEVMRLYLPSTGSLGWAVWPGAGITYSQGIPPDFCPPHVNVGPPLPPPLLLPLPLHATLHSLCPSSTFPTHQDKYGFFKSLIVRLPYSLIFWQFWVYFCFEVSCDSCCGCVRRWSMSTHASMLTGSLTLF